MISSCYPYTCSVQLISISELTLTHFTNTVASSIGNESRHVTADVSLLLDDYRSDGSTSNYTKLQRVHYSTVVSMAYSTAVLWLASGLDEVCRQHSDARRSCARPTSCSGSSSNIAPDHTTVYGARERTSVFFL